MLLWSLFLSYCFFNGITAQWFTAKKSSVNEGPSDACFCKVSNIEYVTHDTTLSVN